MEDQFAWNAYSALHMPSFQVQGLRKAGLNPMLAVGKGISSAPPITSSPGSQDQAKAAKSNAATNAAATAMNAQVADAQIDNLKTSSAKNLADAALAAEKAKTESEMPAKVRQETSTSNAEMKLKDNLAALNRQLEVTESWNTKVKITQHYMNKLEYELANLNLPSRQKAELERAIALARSAKTAADVDEALLMIERSVGVGTDVLGGVLKGKSLRAK